MKRRCFLGGTVAGTLGVVAVGAPSGVAAGDAPNSGSLFITPAVLMAPRADGIEVVWAVSRLCRGWVECQEEGGEMVKYCQDGCGFVPQGDSVMRVRVDGLKPGRVYSIRAVVESGDGPKAREESPWKPFRTLDPAAESARFVVWNDTHERNDTLIRLHQASPSADFLLWNGDTCNDWRDEKLLIPTLLNPGGQDFTAGRPLVLTWGNHDVRGKWAFKIKELIAMPEGKPYGAFRSGPVGVIYLHTGEDKPDAHPSFGGRVALEALRQEQVEWLKTITKDPMIRDASYKVVFCHIPLRWIKEAPSGDYDKGYYDYFARACRDAWHDSLTQWGAQVVISGHTHEEAWIPASEAFPYAQMVSGGPAPDKARWIEGKADESGLTLVMRDLEGKVVHQQVLKRS